MNHIGRRDRMKLGAGVVTAALGRSNAAAQGCGDQSAPPAPGSMPDASVPRLHVGPGYKNTANRLGGNGPMDDTTRQIGRRNRKDEIGRSAYFERAPRLEILALEKRPKTSKLVEAPRSHNRSPLSNHANALGSTKNIVEGDGILTSVF